MSQIRGVRFHDKASPLPYETPLVDISIAINSAVKPGKSEPQPATSPSVVSSGSNDSRLIDSGSNDSTVSNIEFRIIRRRRIEGWNRFALTSQKLKTVRLIQSAFGGTPETFIFLQPGSRISAYANSFWNFQYRCIYRSN